MLLSWPSSRSCAKGRAPHPIGAAHRRSLTQPSPASPLQPVRPAVAGLAAPVAPQPARPSRRSLLGQASRRTPPGATAHRPQASPPRTLMKMLLVGVAASPAPSWPRRPSSPSTHPRGRGAGAGHDTARALPPPPSPRCICCIARRRSRLCTPRPRLPGGVASGPAEWICFNI